MEEPAVNRDAPSDESIPGTGRSDLALVLLLLLLAAGLRTWLLCHTVVTARDSIGFIRYAWQLQHQPWRDVVRTNQHPPLYPLTILAASLAAEHFDCGTEAATMQLAAQLASALAGALLVIPMFFLGRDLFNRKVGIWAAALFQCLPVAVRATSDGLSEGVFLFFAVAALALAVRGFRTYSLTSFSLCGLCGALAYLTRPEGLLVVLAAGVVLLGAQAVRGWRRSWWSVSSCAASLGVSALLLVGPYVAVTGRLTNKETPRRIFGSIGMGPMDASARGDAQAAFVPSLHESGFPPEWKAVAGPPIASILGINLQRHLDQRGSPFWWGLWALCRELVNDFHYLAVLPTLLGLWWFGPRLQRGSGGCVVIVLCGLHVLAVWSVGIVRGYVSERHTLILVACGSYWAVAAVCSIARRSAEYLLKSKGESHRKWEPRMEIAMLLALVGFGVPEVLKPLHDNRAGHHAAGLWLAAHTCPCDTILDPFCWAHYHAGRVFLEGSTPPVPDGHPPQLYVVVECSKNEHDRLTSLSAARKLADQGTLVYRCPLQAHQVENEEVQVYRCPINALTRY